MEEINWWPILLTGILGGILIGYLVGAPLWILAAASLMTVLTWFYAVLPLADGLEAIDKIFFTNRRPK